jgi:uncharacterized protein involved in exopolysaccharide biosynthesis
MRKALLLFAGVVAGFLVGAVVCLLIRPHVSRPDGPPRLEMTPSQAD